MSILHIKQLFDPNKKVRKISARFLGAPTGKVVLPIIFSLYQSSKNPNFGMFVKYPVSNIRTFEIFFIWKLYLVFFLAKTPNGLLTD